MASLIVVGWDPYKGPQIYTVAPGGSVFESKWSLGGSGSGYIYGYVDANYREEFTFEEARKLVVNAISHAMVRDGSSGGVVRLLNVTKD